MCPVYRGTLTYQDVLIRGSKCTYMYIHVHTLTLSSQRTLSPASPYTNLAALSRRNSVSSAFLFSSSLVASFSSYCFCSDSSFSFTSCSLALASASVACFSASFCSASCNLYNTCVYVKFMSYGDIQCCIHISRIRVGMSRLLQSKGLCISNRRGFQDSIPTPK